MAFSQAAEATRSKVTTSAIEVRLRDAVTGKALPGVEVAAHQRLSRSRLRKRATAVTDGAGKARFVLPGLDGTSRSARYIFRAKPFGQTVSSDDVRAPGVLDFPVGEIAYRILDPSTGEPLVGTRVELFRLDGRGRLRRVNMRRTDSAGMLRMDVPKYLSKLTRYVLRVRSPVSRAWRTSPVFTLPHGGEFSPGAPLLRVTLHDALKGVGATYPGARIDAYEIDRRGRLRWRARARTGDDGVALFDLPRLAGGTTSTASSAGSTYLLSTRVIGPRSWSDPVRTSGKLPFPVGRLAIALKHPASGEPLANHRVDIQRRVGEERYRRAYRLRSDDKGIVRADPRGLGDGVEYRAEARSPLSRRSVRSDLFEKPGLYEFQVGSPPVEVRALTAYTGEKLANLMITARIVRKDGRLRYYRRGRTDENGRLDLGLEGIDKGTRFVLETTPFKAGRVRSQMLEKSGPFEFALGKSPVMLKDLGSGEPLPRKRLHAYVMRDDGKLRRNRSGTTDVNGVVRFDLPGVDDGIKYIIKVYNPFGRKKWYETDPITKSEPIEFAIARDEDSEPPKVKILKPSSGAPVSVDGFKIEGTATDNKKVVSMELTVGGKKVPVVRSGTSFYAEVPGSLLTPGDTVIVASAKDAAGNKGAADLRVRVIGDERPPKVEIDKPGAGATVSAEGFKVEGLARDDVGVVALELRVGGSVLPVPLRSTDGGPFAVEVPGTLLKPGDLEIVAVAKDAAGNEGRDSVLVKVVGDETPPVVRISMPTPGSTVRDDGFRVEGTASDDTAVASLELRIGGATLPLAPALRSADGSFAVDVPGALVSPGPLEIVAVARDAADNVGMASVDVTAVGDAAPPAVTITSHVNGADVPNTGFLIGGTASDDSGVVALTISVNDSVRGLTVDRAPVTLIGSAWSFNIEPGHIQTGSVASITVVATDPGGATDTAVVNLDVIGVDASVRQLINRITFGATQELLEHANTIGAAAFIDEQLSTQPEPELAAALATLGTVDSTRDLQTYQVLHAVYARNQLREIMTVFWDNHFNTDSRARNSGFENTIEMERVQNDLWRTNALGRFRDLLGINMRSPSMLIYLDGVSNIAAEPNENLPRELLELHGMGVDGGYTQDDVEEVARAFTGWTVVGDSFFFDSGNHDTGSKLVLGVTIPAGGGESDGDTVLDIIANHPSTARFICTKLVSLLVLDDEPASLVSSCATRFQSTVDDPDQIAQVVRLLLESAEFNAPANRWAKIKTPLEYFAALVRAFEADGDGSDLAGFIDNAGHDLFRNPVPTGYAEEGDDWISSAQLLERMKGADRIAFATPRADRTSIAPRDFMLAKGATTAEAVIGLLFELTVGDTYTTVEWNTAMGVLTDFGATPFDIDAADADARIRSVIGIMVGYPGFQFQ